MNIKTTLIIFITALLTACGGGGSSNAQPITQAPQETANPPAYANAEVLAFGDSTMVGVGGARPQNQLITEELRKLGVLSYVENAAVSGTQLYQMLAGRDGKNPMYAHGLSDRPAARYVLENYGINESTHFTDPDVYRASLLQFVRDTRAAGKVPVIITPNPLRGPTDDVQASWSHIVVTARQVAEEQGVDLIDVAAEFAWITPTNLVDELHPNPGLYQRIAQFEAQELAAIMERATP